MIIVVMGVSGTGKTTLGRLLAEDLGWPFYEGDEFHPRANVEKMRSGVALTDADREPWLARLAALIQGLSERQESAILACSALKKAYRERLRQAGNNVRFVYLQGEEGTLAERLRDREGHYMKAGLLRSQFQALEEPERAVAVNSSLEPGEIAEEVKKELQLPAARGRPEA